MSVKEQDETIRSVEVEFEAEVTNDMIIESIINANANADANVNADATTPLSSTSRIPRHQNKVKETKDYEKYYAPKVVSIGPYHFGSQKLEVVEKLKPVFTMKLLSDNKKTLTTLYNALAKSVNDLRRFYEDDSTTGYSDKSFTKMMLLDGCFILYYIEYIFGRTPDEYYGEFKGNDVVSIHQDLFLMENQIPFEVLKEVTKRSMGIKINQSSKLKEFIYRTITASTRPKIVTWLQFIFCIPTGNDLTWEKLSIKTPHHLLHLLYHTITKEAKVTPTKMTSQNHYMSNFGNANDLVDVGIRFKPSKNMSFAHTEFVKGWLGSANVKLPTITVDEYSTKPKLLNLIAYETQCCSDKNPWVAWYVCLLDSLIDRPEDVKVLRKASVLLKPTGSDEEVVKLFKDVATGLVPNQFAYLEVKNKIQKHYESRRNALFSQLKEEYFDSPWAIFALLGALIALLFSGVQAYFTVWSPKSECSDLCKLLKMNHRL